MELAAAGCARGAADGGRESGHGPRDTSVRAVVGRRLSKMFAHAGADAERRLIAYFWWSPEMLRRNLYSAEFAAQVGAADVGEPLRRASPKFPPNGTRCNACCSWKPGIFSPITI